MVNLNKHTETKSKPKPTSKFTNCSLCNVHNSVVHNTTQNSSDYFSPNVQTISKAQMLSIGREGEAKQ